MFKNEAANNTSNFQEEENNALFVLDDTANNNLEDSPPHLVGVYLDDNEDSFPEIDIAAEILNQRAEENLAPLKQAEIYRKKIIANPNDIEARHHLAILIISERVPAIKADFSEGIIPKNRWEQIYGILNLQSIRCRTQEQNFERKIDSSVVLGQPDQPRLKSRMTCELDPDPNKQHSAVLKFPEQLPWLGDEIRPPAKLQANREFYNHAILSTNPNPKLFEAVFSINDVRNYILSLVALSTRKKMRLINKCINYNLWQVRREMRNQNNIVYMKRFVINYTIHAILFVKNNGKILALLTEYGCSVTREISVPSNDKVKQISSLKDRHYIITESGNVYLLMYQIKKLSVIADESVFNLKKMNFCNEKIKQIFSFLYDFGVLTEEGDIFRVSNFNDLSKCKTLLIPRPFNKKISQIYSECAEYLAMLTESGEIIIYKISELMTRNGLESFVTDPELFPLPPNIRIKKIMDGSNSVYQNIVKVISEQGKVYRLNIREQKLIQEMMPEHMKIEQVNVERGGGLLATQEGTLCMCLDNENEDGYNLIEIPLSNAEKAVQVDSSQGAVSIVTRSGKVQVMGLNARGELALGHNNPVLLPVCLNEVETYKENKVKEFYELHSKQHLKWYNSWLMQSGNDFDKVMALLKIYLEQHSKNQTVVFTLSESSPHLSTYSWSLQKVLNQCSTYTHPDGSVVSENERFNHFAGLLNEMFSPQPLDQSSDLYALLDVIQLETNRLLLTRDAVQNNSISAQHQTEKMNGVSSLRPPCL